MKTAIIKIGRETQDALTPSGNPTIWARIARNKIRKIVPGIRFRWDMDCQFDLMSSGYAMATPEDADKIAEKFGNGVDVIFDADQDPDYKPVVDWIVGDRLEVYSLRIPAILKDKLEGHAKFRGLSLNAYFKNILEEATK